MSRTLLVALALGAVAATSPAPGQEARASPAEESDRASGLRSLMTIGGPGEAGLPSISAQEIVETEKGVYRLTGYADVQHGELRLQADTVIYDSNTGMAEAEGNVVLIQGEGTLGAARMVMNLETGEATLWDVRGYTPPYYRFRAARMERIDEELFWIYDAVFTTCNQPVPYWSFRVKRARVRPGHYARLRGAIFRTSKVPLVYLPYMLWPVKQERASGFLMPQVGSSAERGFFLGTAYYWAMRRNMDATVYLDYYSKAEFAGGLEYRYVPNAVGNGRFVGYILPEDVDPEQSRRWFYHYDADQRFGGGWRLLANLNGISDDAFYRDFERDLDVATLPNEFSTIYLTRSWSYYALALRTERNVQFFTSGDVTQQRLPEAELRARSQRLGNSPFYLSFLGSVNNLAREEPGLDAGYQRADLGFTLSAKLTPASWMDITPTLSVRDTYYTQRLDTAAPDGVSDDPLNRPIYSLGLEILGPKLFRIFEPAEGSGGSRFKNTIEPRIVYTYIPQFDEASAVILYDEVDAIPSDVSLLTYSLTSRILRRRALPPDQGDETAAGHESASEIASVAIAQSVAFNRELSFSGTLGEESRFGPIVLLARYNPTRAVSADLRLDYDILFEALRSVSLSTSSRSSRWGHLSLSYFLSRGLESGVPDSGTLRLGGGSSLWRDRFLFDLNLAYDLTDDVLQSQRYRVGYRTQCCGFSLEYLDNEFRGLLESDKQIRFTVSLQGVGTFLDLNSRVN